MSTPFSVGKVVVATAGTPVQLGVTSLNGAITAAAASLAVASFNGIPPIGGTLFQIDGELVRLTGLSGGNLTWAIQRGVLGLIPALGPDWPSGPEEWLPATKCSGWLRRTSPSEDSPGRYRRCCGPGVRPCGSS